MKHFVILGVLLHLLTANLFGQASFVNYQMGGINSAAFTTNNFKCIAVGKGNVIWAGTQYGGLYIYSDSFNIWRKSDKLTNVFINDIKMDGDSGIWIAQSGTASVGGNSNIAGGVNYFPVGSDISMNFYSVQGTTTSADLLSRNAKGLYVDRNFSAARGDMPRPWVVQGTYITSFNTRRGGVSVGLNRYTPYFTNLPEGFSQLSSATPICESIGGNSQEVWVGTRQNGSGSKIMRYKPSGIFIDSLNFRNDSMLTNGFTAQAIFFDRFGNRWVGLKDGGLLVKMPDSSKFDKMNDPILFPAGTQVNFNAMAEDEYGNVYIGTTNGLLEYQSQDYNSTSHPLRFSSYKRYSTDDGLPSNNITGIAYDQKNGRVLITSAGGVTFMNKREPFIKGVVFDVFCNLENSNPYSGFQKIPLSAGVRIALIKDGVEEETTVPDARGIFELKEANETDVYSVEVRFTKDGRTMRYLYNNIRNHTLMEPALMPDSLIREIKAFKPKLENRCFPFKLYFQLEIPKLLCTDAFNTNIWDAPVEPFYAAAGVTENHKKKVDNLGTYYASLATVYRLGGDATELATEVVSKLFDAVDAMRSFAEFSIELRKPGNSTNLDQVEEDIKGGSIAYLKLLKDGLTVLGTKASTLIKDEESKKLFESTLSSLNEVYDVLIEAVENGRGQAILKVILDNLKSIIATAMAMDYYQEEYAQKRHRYFVQSTALSAYSSESPYSYAESYDNLFNPSSNSLAKYSKDTLDNRKANIATLAQIAKYADMAANAADAATLLAVVPGGQLGAAVAKGLSWFAKGTKTVALTAALVQGAIGAGEVTTLSDSIQPHAGFTRPYIQPLSPLNVATGSADTLVARKNRYNQRLTELQALYLNPSFDPVTFGNKRKQFRVDDSLYTAALRFTLNDLFANADSATARISGFSSRYNRVLDSFVSLQYTLRQSLHFQNIAFIMAPDKTIYTAGLDSISNEIKLANDSAVNGIVSLINDINSNNIPSLPFLAQESYQINHSRAPGSTGTVTYRFRNHGGTAQNNVSFKISQPTAGYVITSADSINVGTIQPGETKQVSFTFLSPLHDSIGHYEIDVKAANGIYQDVAGDFYVLDPSKVYSVKDGNWNDPATWSINAVPAANNKVYITHTVTVTADATCRSVNVFKPGNVVVNTGRRITVTN